MGPVRRWFSKLWWLLKSMFLKLAPARRLLLVLGLLLLTMDIRIGNQVRIDLNTIGQICVVFVLMLELKDKLIAQSELTAGQEVQKALMPVESVITSYSIHYTKLYERRSHALATGKSRQNNPIVEE